jgi:hypothetical protein
LSESRESASPRAPSKKELFELWEAERKTNLVSYLTLTDRPNLGLILEIGDDALRPLSRILEKMGSQDRVDLFLYTRGGSMNAAHNIVKIFREYSKEFNVVVPFRAHSAGTQITLGANHIVMGKNGQLSPVDPSTRSFFNPILNPQGNASDIGNRKPISVEDVQSYLNLARTRVGLQSETDRLEVFRELTKSVEPLALGNINRVYEEAQIIARDLLSMHMDEKTESKKIDAIVKKFTQTYTHFFLISRDEARDVGLKVEQPTPTEEDIMKRLFEHYETELMMNHPYDPDAILGAQTLSPLSYTSNGQLTNAVANQPQGFRLKMGVLESKACSFTFAYDGVVYPPVSQYIPNALGQPGTYPPQPAVRIKKGAWYDSQGLSGNFV